jgi:RES domain
MNVMGKMPKYICWKCFEDAALSSEIKSDGRSARCALCNGRRKSLSFEQLGKRLGDVIQEHFQPGPEVRRFGDDDKCRYEQEGETLSSVLQEVLGQCFDLEEELLQAIVESEEYDPRDGDQPFFDTSCLYIPNPVSDHEYWASWVQLTAELTHVRRFFSESAKRLFDDLFGDAEQIQVWDKKNKVHQPVVRIAKKGFGIWRARVCESRSLVEKIVEEPMLHLGPPPPNRARAGRMNAEGIVVFYGALERDTCLAEMRPSLGGDLIAGQFKTTKEMRILDFEGLERAQHGASLSYFQSDFVRQIARRKFLSHLHSLISRPVLPGNESEYIVTQTLTEYLAHIYKPALDGISFSSTQHEGGKNIVLFSSTDCDHQFQEIPETTFPLVAVPASIGFFQTKSVLYEHKEIEFSRTDDGKVCFFDHEFDNYGDE